MLLKDSVASTLNHGVNETGTSDIGAADDESRPKFKAWQGTRESVMPDWFEMQVRVRYCETDAMGVLHHMNYLAYFEVGRTELFRERGGNYRALEERGYFLVIAKVDCQYKKPAYYDDLLTLRVCVSRMSGAKLEHDYQLLRDGVLIATGHTVLACVDRAGEIQRMSHELLYNATPES